MLHTDNNDSSKAEGVLASGPDRLSHGQLVLRTILERGRHRSEYLQIEFTSKIYERQKYFVHLISNRVGFFAKVCVAWYPPNIADNDLIHDLVTNFKMPKVCISAASHVRMVSAREGRDFGNCPLDLLTSFVIVKGHIVPNLSYALLDKSTVRATFKAGLQFAK